MSFTPNMKPEDVAKLDKERGKKFYDEEDHIATDKDLPVDKKPWLNKTPVNKSGEYTMNGTKILKSFLGKSYEGPEGAEEKISKPLPKKEHKEGESKFEHKIRQWTDEVKERPERFPGGKKQAIAIAAEQSGVSKKGGVEAIMDDGMPELAKNEEVEKALNSRSMYIPRPPGGYDKFDIMRSATNSMTRGNSRLRGPEGVAPLIGETMRTAEDDANVRSKQVTYKSCGSHGLTHRSDTGCMMCHAFSKSTSCKGCGSELEKLKGGMVGCKSCG